MLAAEEMVVDKSRVACCHNSRKMPQHKSFSRLPAVVLLNCSVCASYVEGIYNVSRPPICRPRTKTARRFRSSPCSGRKEKGSTPRNSSKHLGTASLAATHGEQELFEYALNALVRFEHQCRVLDAILKDRFSPREGLLELILEQRCLPTVRDTIRPSSNNGGFLLPRLNQESIKLFADDKVADPVLEVADLGTAEGREVEERFDREVGRSKEVGGSRDAVGVDDLGRGWRVLVLGLVALVEDDGLGASRG